MTVVAERAPEHEARPENVSDSVASLTVRIPTPGALERSENQIPHSRLTEPGTGIGVAARRQI
jgi:hypothetical protein